MLGAYVGVFAVTSVVVGKTVFGERISNATWAGLAIALLGSLVIQLAGRAT